LLFRAGIDYGHAFTGERLTPFSVDQQRDVLICDWFVTVLHLTDSLFSADKRFLA
jgi:hypothetical protein